MDMLNFPRDVVNEKWVAAPYIPHNFITMESSGSGQRRCVLCTHTIIIRVEKASSERNFKHWLLLKGSDNNINQYALYNCKYNPNYIQKL